MNFKKGKEEDKTAKQSIKEILQEVIPAIVLFFIIVALAILTILLEPLSIIGFFVSVIILFVPSGEMVNTSIQISLIVYVYSMMPLIIKVYRILKMGFSIIVI